MKKLRATACLFVFFVCACSKEDRSGWFLDSSFAVQLITFSEEHPIINQEDPARAVEVLQIFRTPEGKDRLFTVNEIRSQELVYETNNSADILRFFRAVRTRTDERCTSTEAKFVFFILAFDRDLMRVGFLKYFPCKREDLGSFQTWGSNSLYFSLEFAKVMNKIIPPSLQRQGQK